MQNILVSIVIPIYKVEPYIVRCIESVLRQTYRNLEVILVDDCTPDQSMEIAKECIANSPLSKDLSFVYLKHDHNRGLSAARNTGIDAATGEYVYFLDSDDEITEDCIEKLTLHADGFQIVQGDFSSFGVNNKMRNDSDFSLCYNDEILNAFSQKKIYQHAWNKLINRCFLLENNLYFREGLINEDELWTFQLCYYTQSFYYYAGYTYLYRVRPFSIMTSIGNRKLIDNLVAIYGLKIDFCIEKEICSDLIYHVLRVFALTIFELNSNNKFYKRKELYYKLMHEDRRSISQKWKSYSSVKSRMKYFYEFLPAFISYYMYSFKLAICLSANTE